MMISPRQNPEPGRPPPRALSLARVSSLSLSALLFVCSCSSGELGGLQDDEKSSSDGHSSSGDGDGDGGPAGDGDGKVVEPAEPGSVDGGIQLDGSPRFHHLVRLTHAQWENSIGDIFGVTDVSSLTKTLHSDPPEGNFSNNEKALFLTEELAQDYQRVAETLAKNISGSDSSLSAFGGVDDPGTFIDRVARRTFRRELTAEEKGAYVDLWSKGATYYASGDAGEDGARVFLEAVLQSPHFLYRIEESAPGERLSGSELATKLSLTLLDRLPSEELLEQAESGMLDDDDGLRTAAEKLLDDERALDVLTRFHAELYGLSRYKTIEKDPNRYPQHTAELSETLQLADSMFFAHIVESDGGFRDILTSPVAFVNGPTSSYYGVQAFGEELQQTMLEEDRPGFLTRLGFLTYNATLTQSDPIHRGVDINNRFLCADLAPPNGVIPPLPETKPGQTNRQRVTEHTGQGSCANCHLKIINPPGFAFENFDAVGQTRTRDNNQDVDTADSYLFSDGEKAFADAPELISIMAEHLQTHGCYASMLGEFILGRDLAGVDVALVTNAQTASLNEEASIKQLVLDVVTNPLFTNVTSGGDN